MIKPVFGFFFTGTAYCAPGGRGSWLIYTPVLATGTVACITGPDCRLTVWAGVTRWLLMALRKSNMVGKRLVGTISIARAMAMPIPGGTRGFTRCAGRRVSPATRWMLSGGLTPVTSM